MRKKSETVPSVPVTHGISARLLRRFANTAIAE